MIIEEERKSSESGIIVVSDGSTIGGVYYLDSQGNYWDEITNKRLNNDEVATARLEEIKQLLKHKVYTKVLG